MKFKAVYSLIFLTLFIFGHSACSSDKYDRRPWWFDEPLDEEKIGSIRWIQYARGTRQRHYTIVKINGEEVRLKGGYIRFASICRNCGKTGTEAVAFDVFSGNENLRGFWVLHLKDKGKNLKDKEKRFHQLCSSVNYPSWRETTTVGTKCNVRFDVATGKCDPADACKTYKSLTDVPEQYD